MSEINITDRILREEKELIKFYTETQLLERMLELESIRHSATMRWLVCKLQSTKENDLQDN